MNIIESMKEWTIERDIERKNGSINRKCVKFLFYHFIFKEKNSFEKTVRKCSPWKFTQFCFVCHFINGVYSSYCLSFQTDYKNQFFLSICCFAHIKFSFSRTSKCDPFHTLNSVTTFLRMIWYKHFSIIAINRP